MKINRQIASIAHRGASGSHPENTIAAFAKAAALGVALIELDVQCTRDHEVVTIHDLTVDRTTNGTGYVRDFTLQDLKTLDAGSWFSPAFCLERIPTLDETIEALAPTSAQLCIEIKGQRAAEAHRTVSRTIKVIEAHNMVERCVITSFTPSVLTLSKRRQPAILTALDPDEDVNFTAQELCAQVLDIGTNLLLQRYTKLSRKLVDEAHAQDIPIWTWTVNDEHDMRTVIDLGVDGIMTDYPDRLHRALSSPMS